MREVYRRFVEDRISERQIADDLNARGMTNETGLPWTRGTVHQVLINEKYIGNNVWNRVSFKLKKKRVHNHPDMWIRSEEAFPGLVDRQLFDAAQTIISRAILSDVRYGNAEGVATASAKRQLAIGIDYR